MPSKNVCIISTIIIVAVIIAIVIPVAIVTRNNATKNDDLSSELSPTNPPTFGPTLSNIILPDGFNISYYYGNDTYKPFIGVRTLRTAYYNGTSITYVGSKGKFRSDIYNLVKVIIDDDSDGIIDGVYNIYNTTQFNYTYPPASIDISNNNELYISMPDFILKCEGNVHEIVLNISGDINLDCNPIIRIPLTQYDREQPYNIRRFIGFNRNNGRLCISNGMVCENCTELIEYPHGRITCIKNVTLMEEIHASNGKSVVVDLTDINADNVEWIAQGLRNSVGFDWAPFNGNMYFTDNGRDEISELYPDDELNVINTNQANYGFPNCHTLGSGPTIDRDVGCTKSFRDPLVVANCNSATLNKNAILALGPRVVPLGMRFYTGNMFPTDFTNAIFIAERGSGTDISDRIGFRIVAVKLNETTGLPLDHKIFAYGWEVGNDIINGRPVDVSILNDGSLLISDDDDNAIYRITYNGDKSKTFFNYTNNNNNCDYSYVLD